MSLLSHVKDPNDLCISNDNVLSIKKLFAKLHHVLDHYGPKRQYEWGPKFFIFLTS